MEYSRAKGHMYIKLVSISFCFYFWFFLTFSVIPDYLHHYILVESHKNKLVTKQVINLFIKIYVKLNSFHAHDSGTQIVQ